MSTKDKAVVFLSVELISILFLFLVNISFMIWYQVNKILSFDTSWIGYYVFLSSKYNIIFIFKDTCSLSVSRLFLFVFVFFCILIFKLYMRCQSININNKRYIRCIMSSPTYISSWSSRHHPAWRMMERILDWRMEISKNK